MVQEREEQLGQSHEEVQQLQQHMSRLLGVAPSEVPSLTAVAVPTQPVELSQRVAQLEVRRTEGLRLVFGSFVQGLCPGYAFNHRPCSLPLRMVSTSALPLLCPFSQ